MYIHLLTIYNSIFLSAFRFHFDGIQHANRSDSYATHVFNAHKQQQQQQEREREKKIANDEANAIAFILNALK